MILLEADIRKQRIRALDNGPAQIQQRVATPTASVITKITVLSTSNTTSRSPATVERAAPGAQGNLPGELGQAYIKLPQRPRVTVSEKSAPRRGGLVDGAPSAEPETLCPSQRREPHPTATGCSCSMGATNKVSGLESAKCRLNYQKPACCRSYKSMPKRPT